jgi:hypothetical protein
VEPENGRADQDTDDLDDGDGQHPQQDDIQRSIRPGTGTPPTVLVADMGNGALFVEGWRDGPSAYLSPSDALPLRRVLAMVFGSTVLPPSSEPDEAP